MSYMWSRSNIAFFYALAFSLLLLPTTAHSDDVALRIFAVHFPPYEFEAPEEGLKGFDVEVVEALFLRLGKPVKIEFMPWTRAVKTVFDGQAMALLSCARRAEREPYVYFSSPISLATTGYFQRIEDLDPGYQTLEGLRGQKVVAVRGYSTQESLTELSIEHLAVRSNKLALNILSSARADYLYGYKEGNQFIAKQLGLSDKLRFHPLSSENYHLCFSKFWPQAEALLEAFNQQLKQLKSDGSYDAIHDKYR